MSRLRTQWAAGAPYHERGALGPPGATRLVTAGLVAVAVVWGLSFVVIKDALATMAPSDLVGWRFASAAAVLAALRPRSVMIMDRRTVTGGLGLGLLLGLGFLLCAYGMQTTSVLVAAFVVGTTVVITPLVARSWLGRRLSGRTLLATGLATAGLMLLTLRGVEVGGGAVMILIAAALFAVHLCALGRWVSTDKVVASTLVQLTTAAVVSLLVSLLVNGEIAVPPPAALGGVVYLGAAATAGAFLVLTWAQTRVDATTTAILLTLEPVVGGAAAVVLGEPVTVAAAAGAGAVLGASVLVTTGGRPSVAVADLPMAQDGARVVTRSRARRSPPACSAAGPAAGAARLPGHGDRPALRTPGAGDRLVRCHSVHQ